MKRYYLAFRGYILRLKFQLLRRKIRLTIRLCEGDPLKQEKLRRYENVITMVLDQPNATQREIRDAVERAERIRV